jgi:hypothetical protein
MELQILSLSDSQNCGFWKSVAHGIVDSENQTHRIANSVMQWLKGLWILKITLMELQTLSLSDSQNCRFCHSVAQRIVDSENHTYKIVDLFCHSVSHNPVSY